MKFNGTIVITDPCYLDYCNQELQKSDWWYEFLDNSMNMTLYGFSTYICESTIIGDWSWVTMNEDTNKEIGAFGADAGLVCVCYLDEINKFNPYFKEWVESHKWCATIIENFEGYVQYDVGDDDFHIVGKGNINFKTY